MSKDSIDIKKQAWLTVWTKKGTWKEIDHYSDAENVNLIYCQDLMEGI